MSAHGMSKSPAKAACTAARKRYEEARVFEVKITAEAARQTQEALEAWLAADKERENEGVEA